MGQEISGFGEYRDTVTEDKKLKLEEQGWRPLPDVEFTHTLIVDEETGELVPRQTRTVDDIKTQVLAEYRADGYDEATILPTDADEKEPQGFFVFIRSGKLREQFAKPEAAPLREAA